MWGFWFKRSCLKLPNFHTWLNLNHLSLDLSIKKAVKCSRRNYFCFVLKLFDLSTCIPNVSILSWDCFNEKLIGSSWWVHVKQTFSIKSWVFQAWFMSSSCDLIKLIFQWIICKFTMTNCSNSVMKLLKKGVIFFLILLE